MNDMRQFDGGHLSAGFMGWSTGYLARADDDDNNGWRQCPCGRGRYNAFKHQSCYECYQDRFRDLCRCIYCGRPHGLDFDTCYKCSPQSGGRDDAAKALRQLILWRDQYECQYCGAREGDEQYDPTAEAGACPRNCHERHRCRKDCPRLCEKDEHAHDEGCPEGCKAEHAHAEECFQECKVEHAHRSKPDEGIRPVRLEVDHIVPCARGGRADEWNLQVLCGVCNRAKGSTWHVGCRHEETRTELCRRYFPIAGGYFRPADRARFNQEYDIWNCINTWDPGIQERHREPVNCDLHAAEWYS